MKVKVKILVSSDDEETLKYPYVQIRIEIRSRNRTAIPLIKDIHHPDIGHCQTHQHKVFKKKHKTVSWSVCYTYSLSTWYMTTFVIIFAELITFPFYNINNLIIYCLGSF